MSFVEKAVSGCRRMRESFSCARSFTQCCDDIKHTVKTVDLSRSCQKRRKRKECVDDPFRQRVVKLSELPEP